MKPSIRFALIPLLLATACSNHRDAYGSKVFDVSPAQLQAAMGNNPAAEFYRRDQWLPMWSAGSAKELEQVLAKRTENGLDRVSFLADISKGTPAQKEAALTKAALAYAAALSNGLTDPTKLYPIYSIPRPQVDLIDGLQQPLADGKVADWFAKLAPQDAEYAALSKAYLHYRDVAAYAAQHQVPAGKTISPDATDPRILAIRDLLTREGYLAVQTAQAPSGQPAAPAPSASASAASPQPSQSSGANAYTPDLVAAIKALQNETGLDDNGKIDAGTLAALNRAAVTRGRALAVALERRRWLVRNPPETRIDVNTGAAILLYYRDGKLVDQRKVVVGQPGKETPQIEAPIYRLVANPTWTIPKSIASTELAGKGAGYLKSHNMAWKDGWIVQQSGPDNSLGLVKFDMQDKYEIYLHDTPAKALFDLDERQRSHGCVRVFDALGFADMLAGQENIADQWKQARAKQDETFVPLPQKIPVRLLYHPTYVTRSGAVQFGEDIYGWDGPVAQQLGYDRASGRRIYATIEDLGP